MEEQKQNPLDFLEQYGLLVSTDSYVPPAPLIKICRFCRQDESSTTFTNIPHAIPELLGANEFITADECDKCNKHFSKYESHLSKFFLPYLAMVGVKGRKGTPAFHSRTENQDGNTRTIVKFEETN
ncbi:MAG: hypothetical protein EOO45_17670 [Flavobacterium sp.]|nr:MAG: hypothetical protein EOO45_17670 [Flavobacterium sp.]